MSENIFFLRTPFGPMNLLFVITFEPIMKFNTTNYVNVLNEKILSQSFS